MLKKIGIIISLLILLTGCDPVKDIVNKAFPPLNTLDQQYSAVLTNLKTIESIEPQLGIYVDRLILDKYIPSIVDRKIKEAKEAEEYKKQDLEVLKFEPELSFDKQGIFIDAKFHIRSKKEKVETKGKMQGVLTVSVDQEILFVRGAFKTLNVAEVSFDENPSLKDEIAAKLAIDALKGFIDNINGIAFKDAYPIELKWGEATSFNAKELFDKSVQVASETITISRHYKKGSIKIDKNGISIIAEVSDKPNESIDIEDVSDLQDRNITKPELSKLYKDFSIKFDTSWTSSLDKAHPGSAISIHISKAEMSKILNEALGKPVTLKQTFDTPKILFDEKIQVDRDKIDCQKVRKEFKRERYTRKSCTFNSCSEASTCRGRDCNFNCLRCFLGACSDDPSCLAREAACAIKNNAELLTCNGAREARIAACNLKENAKVAKCNADEEATVAKDNIDWNAAKAKHDFENEAAVAACDAQRELTDFMALGRFKGDINGNGSATIHLTSANVSEDLSNIDLTFASDVQAKIPVDLKIQPYDLGYLFMCISEYRFNKGFKVNVNTPEQVMHLKISGKKEDGDLIIFIQPSPIDYSAQITPNPLTVLLNDSGFISRCTALRTLMGVTVGTVQVATDFGLGNRKEQTAALTGKIKDKYEIDTMTKIIKPIPVKVNEQLLLKSEIEWGEKSIQFYIEKGKSL